MNQGHLYASTSYEPFSRTDASYEDAAAQKHTETRNAMQKEHRTARAVPNSGRIVLRLVGVALALSIIGVQAHTAVEWNRTREQTIQDPSNGFSTRAWPADTDLWPTWTNIIAASIAALIHTSALITLCGDFHKLRQTRYYSATVILTSLLSITAWVTAVVYYKVDNARGKKHWDVWSWSCSKTRFRNSLIDFKPLCIELSYSFYALIVASAIEVLCLVLFIIIQTREKKRSYRLIVPVASAMQPTYPDMQAATRAL